MHQDRMTKLQMNKIREDVSTEINKDRKMIDSKTRRQKEKNMKRQKDSKGLQANSNEL